MLSYLKDGNQVPASSDMPGSDQAACSTEDYLTVSGQSQKVRRSTMILAVLFAVGALGLWLMVKKTTPATANAEPSQNQVQLETALAQLDSMKAEIDSQMNSVSGRFYQFNNVDQVGVEELKKNPFIRGEMESVSGTSGNGSQQQEQIQQEAQVISMGLELWSITATPKGMCCMIDDKVLYQGDTYRNMTVKSITEKAVTLEYKGTDVELKMD
jgi:preprotein translocase subunit SecG